MTTALTIMILVSAFLVICIILGWAIDDWEPVAVVALVLLAMQLVFGYVIIGLGATYSTEKLPVDKAELAKSSTTIFVKITKDDEQQMFELTSYKDYTEVNDSTYTFYILRHNNMYNGKSDSKDELIYELKTK